MKTPIINPLLAIAFIAALAAAPLSMRADDKPLPPTKIEPQKETRKAGAKPGVQDGTKETVRSMPFKGKLDAVDKAAHSIKIGDRNFQVLPTTRITLDGTRPGTLDDAKVGETVAGAYREAEGGAFQLVSLRLGPKPEKRSAAEKKK